MPELPDAAIFKQYFDATALHKPVCKVAVLDERVLDGSTPQQLGRVLNEHSFTGSRQHGKYLFAGLESGSHLALHFGMTGSLSYREASDESAEHTKVRFDFAGDGHLDFVCPRMLGRVAVIADIERFLDDHDIGPDAMSLSREDFRETAGASAAMIKSTLMDQSKLAGIGNIYSDEILFQARIDPRARASGLSDTELDRLYDCLRRILLEAIERHADPAQMPPRWLIGHRRDGANCPLCDGNIATLSMGSSTGYYCPAHQS